VNKISSDRIYNSQAASLYDSCPSPRYEYLARYISEMVHPVGKHYDVGCGTGSLINILNQKGWSSSGCDPSQAMLFRARKKNPGLHIELASCSDFPLDDSVQLVTATFDVLNHLDGIIELRSFFDRAFNKLQFGGVLIFDTVTPGDISNNWDGYIQIDQLPGHAIVRTGAVLTEYSGRLRYDFYKHDKLTKSWSIVTEEHILVTYDLEDIMASLSASGFRSFNVVDHETLLPPTSDCVRWLIAATK